MVCVFVCLFAEASMAIAFIQSIYWEDKVIDVLSPIIKLLFTNLATMLRSEIELLWTKAMVRNYIFSELLVKKLVHTKFI